MKATPGEGKTVSDQQVETKHFSDVRSPNKPPTAPKNPNYQHLSATQQKPSTYQILMKATPHQMGSTQKELVTTDDIYEEIEQ